MFAYGACLSFDVLHHIAQACGLSPRLAWAWPLGFEAFMAVAAISVLAEQRARPGRVPWYPWTLTALAAGSSIALNFAHPFIPLDPPPQLLVACVYGVPPVTAPLPGTCSCCAWPTAASPTPSTIPGRNAPRTPARRPPPRRPAGDPAPALAGSGQDGEPSRAAVRVLLAAETQDAPVSWQDVTARTGLSRSRAYALLREERARQAAGNGHHPPAMLRPHPGQEAP